MEYYRTKTMHQYYRDVYTVQLKISETGNLPLMKIIEFTYLRSLDLFSLYQNILSIDSGLPEKHDKGLKKILLAIGMSNLALDNVWHGQQTKLPQDYITSIKNCIFAALEYHPNLEYLEIAIKILFRVGDIESVIELVSKNSEHLLHSPDILKIMLLISNIEENYEDALALVKILIADPDLIGEDPLALLMTVSTIYKNGGIPEDYIDFKSLFNNNLTIPQDEYIIAIPPAKANENTTILVCCDPGYYEKHAIHLMRSIYHTNKGELNLHFHIYNINNDILTDIKKYANRFPELNISCTSEVVAQDENKKTAYASKRFIFAEHALKLLSTPVLIVDADSLIRKPWKEISNWVEDNDLLVNKPEVSPFWESIIGGFVWLGGKEQSTSYIKKVSLFLRSNFAQGNYPWFIDQVALSAVMHEMEKKQPVRSIPTEWVFDIRHNEQSFAWSVTTIKKGNKKYEAYQAFLEKQYPA